MTCGSGRYSYEHRRLCERYCSLFWLQSLLESFANQMCTPLRITSANPWSCIGKQIAQTPNNDLDGERSLPLEAGLTLQLADSCLWLVSRLTGVGPRQ